MPVFVLAAGLGTRLRPLTSYLPKPLLPVGDRPALAHILQHLRGLPGPIVANAHHLLDDLRAFLTAEAPHVRLSEEAHILGTAGGLRAAGDLLRAGHVLVWNGDILSSLDAGALIAAHADVDEATLAMRPLPMGEGNVGADAVGRIVRLRRETTGPGEVRGGAFLGIHVVGERLRATLPVEGCLVGDVYLPALRAGASLRAWDAPRVSWHDIGTLRDYREASFAWLGDRSAFVHPEATVANGVTVTRSIVGRGARVEHAIEDCIVWPDTHITVPAAASVVTPWGVVPYGM